MDKEYQQALEKLYWKLDAIIQAGETDPDVRKGNRILTKTYALQACVIKKVGELLEFIESENVTDLKVIDDWLNERSKFAEDGMGVIGPRDSDLYCEGLGHPIVHKGSRDPGK